MKIAARRASSCIIVIVPTVLLGSRAWRNFNATRLAAAGGKWGGAGRAGRGVAWRGVVGGVRGGVPALRYPSTHGPRPGALLASDAVRTVYVSKLLDSVGVWTFQTTISSNWGTSHR